MSGAPTRAQRSAVIISASGEETARRRKRLGSTQMCEERRGEAQWPDSDQKFGLLKSP